MAWRLLQYKSAYDGLIAQCDQPQRDAIQARLVQLLVKGNQATYPITEPLGDGLFELRARCKKVRIRLLFGFLPGQRIVVVWCGMKDQRKLPAATIQHARTLLVIAKVELESLNVVYVH